AFSTLAVENRVLAAQLQKIDVQNIDRSMPLAFNEINLAPLERRATAWVGQMPTRCRRGQIWKLRHEFTAAAANRIGCFPLKVGEKKKRHECGKYPSLTK